MARRQYSDADKASALAALDANGGNVARTARELSIPRQTLDSWTNERGINHDVPELRQEKRGELAEQLEAIAYTLAGDLVKQDKRELATLQQIATSLGIVVDKMQLLRGKPTAINEEVSDSRERLARLLDRHAAATAASGDPGGVE